MRHSFVLGLATVVAVEGFVPLARRALVCEHHVRHFQQTVSSCSFSGRALPHVARLSKRIGTRAAGAVQDVTIMSLDGGKVMVTGFLNAKERTDQFVFDILQAQSKWEKIVAFSDNMAFAKKRLISRKSRYSGLLDVLEFDEGDKYDSAVMQEKLQGCSAWLCFDCEGDKVKDSVEFAKKAGVKSMVISSTISAADAASAGIEDALKDSGLEYTFIRVGEIIEGKEGGAVMASNLTDDLPMEKVVRDDIVRLSAEAFMMENATNKAISFGKGDELALEYLKELRQNGTDRRTELSMLISGGFREYQEIKAAEEAERNKPPPTEEELAERERLFYESREEEYAAIRKENAKKRLADEKKKAEKEATELLDREWNAAYWARNTTQTIEEYIADEENWERAMEHGWAVVKKENDERFGSKKSPDEDQEDDDDDDDDEEEIEYEEVEVEDDEDEEGEIVAEDEEEEGEGQEEGGEAGIIASKEGPPAGKTKKKATKTEGQEIVAESKDEAGSEGADSPRAKLDDAPE